MEAEVISEGTSPAPSSIRKCAAPGSQCGDLLRLRGRGRRRGRNRPRSWWTRGGALATGLAIGSINGALAARLIALPIPFLATSLLRILTLSTIGIAIGLAFGLANVWLVILGLGISQVVLARSQPSVS